MIVLLRLVATSFCIFWMWNSLPMLRTAVIVCVVLNELATFVFSRWAEEKRRRDNKAIAIHKAMQNCRVGNEVVVYNDDGSVWCIVKMVMKEHEHEKNPELKSKRRPK
jgi:hypothetical protein